MPSLHTIFSSDSKSTDISLLKKLFRYISPHMSKIILAAIFLLIALTMELFRPLLLKKTIDGSQSGVNLDFFLDLAGLYLATIVIGFIASFGQNYILKLFGQNIIYDIRNDVFRKIIARPKEEFEKTALGNLVTRITNDSESLRALFTDVLLKIISSVLLLIGILIFMYFLNPRLAMITFLIIPVMGYITVVYRRYSRKAFRGVRTKVAESNSYVQEVLNFIIIIKTYLGESIVAKRYDKVSEEYLQAGLYEVKTFALFRPLVDTLYFMVILVILIYTNWFDSIADAGTIFAALQYVEKIFSPLKEIAEKYNMLQQSLAGAERLVPILNEKSENALEEVVIPTPWQSIEKIEFKNVWFSYGEEYILKDISFCLNRGEFLGIVGPSGAGKSTLISLLMGFIKPQKGDIFINNINIQKYQSSILRELMGFVFQDSHLFKGTIRENIALFDNNTSEENISRALKQAHLYSLVERLPQKLDTPVGYLGSLLSEGQKQLLALTRALVKNKPILIFDEATANIDSDTERLIQQSIEEERGEKTIISIAHRLSTVRNADKILFVESGSIVEEGCFDDLLARKGHLYRLWSANDKN